MTDSISRIHVIMPLLFLVLTGLVVELLWLFLSVLPWSVAGALSPFWMAFGTFFLGVACLPVYALELRSIRKMQSC